MYSISKTPSPSNNYQAKKSHSSSKKCRRSFGIKDEDDEEDIILTNREIGYISPKELKAAAEVLEFCYTNFFIWQ